MMIKKIIPLFLIIPIATHAADDTELNSALRATYTACVGIDENLSELKKMAGINTAITAVGTGLGAGAVAVGVAKSRTDDILQKKYQELRIAASQYQEEDPSDDARQNFQSHIGKISVPRTNIESSNIAQEIDELTQKSKSLGNWRTGLMAGNTATNIAGAVIAGKNKTDSDLDTQIDNCRAAVAHLRQIIPMARVSGTDVTEATNIASICGEFNYIDISKINKRARGAMISSVVGAVAGGTGTVVSAVANTDKVRAGAWEQEKNLNTAANVLAGTGTVASASATIFNATQISAIKQVASVAEKCTEVLK